MKIRIWLDVFQDWQNANSFVIECGESKNNISYVSDNCKRYEIEVEVPHPTDAEKINPISMKETP